MPELPEVQTVVNHLRDDLIGEKILSITPIWPKVLHNFSPKDINTENDNTRILDVFRRAKFIIIQLEEKILAVHLRMTGKLYLSKKKFPKHVTAFLKLSNNKKIVFYDIRKFGRFYLFDNLDPINNRHGPEPLDDAFTVDLFFESIYNKKRRIKALLLDQSFLSGLGNIYVDESLWHSGIHPNSISNNIPKSKIKILHKNIRKILKNAINKKGTTIIDFYVNGESGKYSHDLCIYGKIGEPCTKCGNKIEKLRIAGRGTYICQKCQKLYKKKL